MKNLCKYLSAIIICLLLTMCYPGKERMHEYRLMRYKQVEQVEKQFSKVVNLVNLEQSGRTNALFRAKYRRDLEKSFAESQDLYEDEVQNQEKLAKLLKEKGPLFTNTENTFDDKTQLGFSVENQMYKLSFLNSLKKVTANARVLNVDYQGKEAVITARAPFSTDVTKTNKLVLTYLTAKSDEHKKVKAIRRYQDVILKMKVESVNLQESDHYVVVEVNGKLTSATSQGWLGIRKWKNESPLLPLPGKNKEKKSKPSKRKKRKEKSSSSSSSSSKSTTTNVKAKVNQAKTNLEENWQEDDGDDGW